MDEFLGFSARGCKSRMGGICVLSQLSKQSFIPGVREWNVKHIDRPLVGHVRQSAGCFRRIALVTSESKREISQFGCGLRTLAFNRVDDSRQGRHACSSFELDICSTSLQRGASLL